MGEREREMLEVRRVMVYNSPVSVSTVILNIEGSDDTIDRDILRQSLNDSST